MPDAATRVQVFFESQGKVAPTGWTETYYSSVSGLADILRTVTQTYVKARCGLLGNGTFCKYVRVGKVPSTRVTRVAYITGKAGEPTLFTTSPEDDFDPTQVDLLCRATTPTGKRRQMWIAGLPDSVTDTLKLTGVSGAFTSSPAWKQFVKGVTDSALGMRYKITDPSPGFEFDLIAEIQPIAVRNRKRGRPFDLFHGRRLA